MPVIEKVTGGYKVKVGSVAPPDGGEALHYRLQWIEVIASDKAYREFLKPGQAPEAVFLIDAPSVIAREYCNLHGQWKA